MRTDYGIDAGQQARLRAGALVESSGKNSRPEYVVTFLVFMDLRARGIVPIHGLNYKDRPDDAARWLAELGDPYTRTGADLDGRVAIDWGVYGVPETFVVDREGRIAYKHIGPVTPRVMSEKLMPLIEHIYSSGHRMRGSGLKDPFGLIRSRDSGRTWVKIAEGGSGK